MKIKDLRERTTPDLKELRAMLRKDVYQHRVKNFTGQLDDTSLIKKARRDIARIELVLAERTVAEGSAL